MSLRFRIVLSAAFAVLGLLSCLAYADSVREQAEHVRQDAIARFGGEVAQLVVATKTLETGEAISERNVRVCDWVSDLAPADAITSLDEVVGRELRVPVSEGSPLTELDFRGEEALAEVPSGHVALSVPATDKLGIARGVTRGSRVSAYAVSGGEPKLLAGDIEVLSELSSAPGVTSSQQLTIAVLPEQVPAVLGASATGDLRLVIPADDVDAPKDDTREGGPPEKSEAQVRATDESDEQSQEGASDDK